MAEKRQLELMLLRIVPHPLREDSMTVGLVVVEPEGEFAEVRFTRDWRRLECFAPDLDMEWFAKVEGEIREGLKSVRTREGLLQMTEAFGSMFEVGRTKGLLAADPTKEMGVLEQIYLAPAPAMERARGTGRMRIVAQMESAFTEAGVIGLLQRDLPMTEFTGEFDPFTVDFGFRVGTKVKMFHGLALSLSREPAIMLAHRYERIQSGMKARGDEPLLTAVISEFAARREDAAPAIAMLREREITVRDVGEMAAIAEEVRGAR